MLFVVLLVQPVSNGSCGGFVDDTFNLEPRDRSCVLGGLALGVVEVGWDCHNRVLDFLSKIGFGDFFHLPQNHTTDFLGSELILGMRPFQV
mmetsp:Transcript_22773/g.52677  ORF Transcript_22773/g.52677 Transcript_22773/m.52677 type:complete len:91 (-) Transcript_22773:55-327(-)